MVDVTSTDRPKSVCSRCVIEVFGGVFVFSIGFQISCWHREFCHRTESDLIIFLFRQAECFNVLYQYTLAHFHHHLNRLFPKKKLHVPV